ncbi:MAG TPA: DUF6569 family protein [Planctomycetota bacterium]|nr:DUF6569 family protein [Planctomycetota bacterium]
MRTITAPWARIGLVALLCICTAASAAESSAEIKLDENHSLITPIQYKNLTVWQVAAQTVEKLDNVVPLQKAQEDKNIDIHEIAGGAEVNRLVIENKGKVAVLVLAGTIVKGGKQDRQIGQDFVLNPGQTVNVDSFCVEHGRWTENRQTADTQQRQEEPVQQGRPTSAPNAANVAPASVATGGKFEAQTSMASSSVRANGQYKADQGAVWSKVAEENKANAVAPASGTFMASKEKLATDEDRKAIVALLKAKCEAPAGRNVVGLAYAVNGEIVNIRYFLAPNLYAGFAPAMIETIADDTVTRNAALGEEKVKAYAQQPKALSGEEFKTFMYAERSKKETRDTPAANCNGYYENKAAYSSETTGKEGALKDKVISADYTSKK